MLGGFVIGRNKEFGNAKWMYSDSSQAQNGKTLLVANR